MAGKHRRGHRNDAKAFMYGVSLGILVSAIAYPYVGYYDNNNAPERNAEQGRRTWSVRREDLDPDLSRSSASCELGEAYLNMAIQESKRPTGDGHTGLLYLLAAHDLCESDAHILDSVVDNYVRSGYKALAVEALATLARKMERRQEFSKAEFMRKRLQQLAGDDAPVREDPAALEAAYDEASRRIPPPSISLPFSTAVAEWDLSDTIADMDSLHDSLYEEAMKAYFEMKRTAPAGLSDTKLNHRFFQWQMDILKSKGDYFKGFRENSLWKHIAYSMKAASSQILNIHTGDKADAWSKASHRTVMWVSVHTDASIHEPHMTHDSLIGGVYYLRIPKSVAGDLALYDPRGVSPLAKPSSTRLPNPPYHRRVVIKPTEGKLVLFPGWLIHQVLPASGKWDVRSHGYRISISVNLKGEWQDTSALTLRGLNASHFAYGRN